MATTVTATSRRKFKDYFEGKNSAEYVYEAVSVSIPTSAGYYSKSESDARFVNVTGDTMTGDLVVTNLITSGNVDGRDVSADGAWLDTLYTTIGLSALTAGEVNQLENIGTVTISNVQWGYLGALDQELTQASAVTFATVNTGHGANELYAMNQDVETTDSPTFATAKLSNLTDGYVPYHVSDATGLANSVLYTDGTNIGIGTTTPGYKLDLQFTGNNWIRMNDTTYPTSYAQFGLEANVTKIIGNSTDIAFRTNGGGWSDKITIKNAGNVGIGTTDPDAKLDVNGDVIVGTDIGSSVYSSGFAGSGWQYDDSEDRLTVDNLTVRKQMRVYELLIEQIRANRGAIVVSPGNAKILSNVTGTVTIDAGDDNRFPMSLVANDIIRCQRWNGTGIKYYIASVDSVTGDTFTYTIIDGLDDIAAGDEVVVVGNSTNTARQGLIYITSSDDNAPYLDILDGVTDGDFAGHQKVRLGKLDGITDADVGGALTGYGLYSENVYLKGTIVASLGEIGGFTISSIDGLYSGTGVTRVQMKPGAGFWAGATAIGDAPFSVTEAGSLKAEDGLIGGWTINENGISYIDTSGGTSKALYLWNNEVTGTTQYGRGFSMYNADSAVADGGVKIISVGQIRNKDTYATFPATPEYGFEVIKKISAGVHKHVIRLGENEALIGGWEIDSDAIYTGTKYAGTEFTTTGITLNSNGGIHTPMFYVNSLGKSGFRADEIIYGYAYDAVTTLFDAGSSFTNSNTTYAIMDTITLGANLRSDLGVGFAFRYRMVASDYTGLTAYIRIYVEGVAVGEVQVIIGVDGGITYDGGYITHSEQLTVNAGDVVTLRGYIDGGNGTTETIEASYFRVTGAHTAQLDEVTAS